MKSIVSYFLLIVTFVAILVAYDWHVSGQKDPFDGYVVFTSEVIERNSVDFIVVEANTSGETLDDSDVDNKPYYLTKDQYTVLRHALEVGEPYGLGLTMMAIALQESSAGRFGPVGDLGNGFGRRSYGVMQIKLQTAKHVIEHFDMPEPNTDEELIAQLINDEEYNMNIALHYLLLLRNSGMDWRELVTAYNQGPTGSRLVNPQNFYYTERIAEMVQTGIPVEIREIRANSE